MMNEQTSLNDPRKLYPAPPFPDQPQSAPGVARKMDPTPDHGEKSYRGSGKLSGRKALVTGGDSGIGRAAAIAFAREGADVAIAYLADEEADAKEVIDLIEAEGRKALALPGDISKKRGAGNWSKRLSPASVVSTFSSSMPVVSNIARR
jgi:short chain dehydrogenase